MRLVKLWNSILEAILFVVKRFVPLKEQLSQLHLVPALEAMHFDSHIFKERLLGKLNLVLALDGILVDGLVLESLWLSL